MGFWKWTCRVGAPGGTARTLTKVYYTFKRKFPEASDTELCRMVVGFRLDTGICLSGKQRARLELLMSRPPCAYSLENMVQEIVKTESNIWGVHDFGNRYFELMQLVEEEVAKSRAKFEGLG